MPSVVVEAAQPATNRRTSSRRWSASSSSSSSRRRVPDIARSAAVRTPGARLTDDGAQCEGPLEHQVRVVLPGVADAAQHLDAVLGVRRRGVDRDGQGDRGREVARRAGRLVQRTGGVPRRGPCLLGPHEHVGAQVLDRLEGADGRPNCSRVLAYSVASGGTRRPARCLGDEHDMGEGDGGSSSAGNDVAGGADATHQDGRAGLIDARDRLQFDIGPLGSTIRTSSPSTSRRTSASPPPRIIPSPSPTAPRHVPSTRWGNHLYALGVDPAGGHHGGGCDGRDEGPWSDRCPHRLHNNGQLAQPEAGSSESLRDVNPEPPELDELRPERRHVDPYLFQASPSDVAHAGSRGERMGDPRELEVVFDDGDPHGSSFVEGERRRRRTRSAPGGDLVGPFLLDPVVGGQSE